ncbi:hypothetical protein RHMOL_Rhmol01G0262500 [Rhododendron molle]|uniref:Uncharacterized protein n=1 Tax=Rhododendron molle TaxID=49168 RepID=A0ACC0Q6Y2_RHOML|nr:hypothetical protein RHMOL_Rhmol01G0262500 [Rhododendron molle]
MNMVDYPSNCQHQYTPHLLMYRTTLDSVVSDYQVRWMKGTIINIHGFLINVDFQDWTIRLLYTTGVANEHFSNLWCNTMQLKMLISN